MIHFKTKFDLMIHLNHYASHLSLKDKFKFSRFKISKFNFILYYIFIDNRIILKLKIKISIYN